MAAFGIFKHTQAPPGEPSNMGGGSGSSGRTSTNQRRESKLKPFIVGGNLNAEGVPAVTTELDGEIISEPTDAMSPMAVLRNSLSGIARLENLTDDKIREIIVSRAEARAEEESKAVDKSAARARGRKVGETEFENLVTVSLPALRESLIYWTGNLEVGDEVTLQTALKAIQSIEDGTKAKQDFAFNYTKSFARDKIVSNEQSIQPGRTAQKILDNPNLRNRFDAVWSRISAYDASQVASRETTNDINELNTIFAEALGVNSSDTKSESLREDKSEIDKIKRLTNAAQNRGQSLQATLEEVLRQIKLKDPTTGRSTTALRLLNIHKNELVGDNSFVQYPSTDVTTAYQLAEQYFNQPRRDGTFVLDRTNGRPKPNAEAQDEREYSSIGKPISKILYRLKTNADAITDPEGEIESEPISVVLSEVQDELVTELTETLGTAISRPLKDAEVEKFLKPLVLTLNQENVLNDIYDEALAIYNKEVQAYSEARKKAAASGTDDLETWKTPDEFALLQRHFTAVLAERLQIPEILNELDESELPDLKLEFSGIERDPEVEAMLRSEDTDRDLGAKRMKVEAFIQNLRDFGEITKEMCPKCTDDERNRMSLIAKAIYHYANEKRLERWDPTNNKADESATTLNNYAVVFRTLSRRGLIEPLPAAHIAPPQADNETNENYTLRLREHFAEANKLRTETHTTFVDNQRALIIRDLRALVTGLNSKAKLANFLGTLGKIFNKTGNALKDEINYLIEEIETQPEKFIENTPADQLQDTKPYQIYIDGKLMQPKQETIATLESLYTKTESVQIAFDKLENELKVLMHRVQNETETNPEALDTAITNWFNNYQSQVIEPLEKLRTDEKLTAILNHNDENLRRSSAYLYNAYFNLTEGNRRLLKQFQTEVRAKVPTLANAAQNADIVNAALLKATEGLEKLEDELKVTNGALDTVVVENTSLRRESEQLRAAVKGRVSDLRETTETLNKQEGQLTEQTEQIKQIEVLNKTITTLRETVENQAAIITQSQARTERDTADKAKLNTMLTERDAEIVSLGHELAALTTTEAAEALTEELNNLRDELKKSQLALSESQQKLTVVEQELAQLRNAPQEEQRVPGLAERITTLEYEVDTLRERNDAELNKNDSLVELVKMFAEEFKGDSKYAALAAIIDEQFQKREEENEEGEVNKSDSN